MRVSICSSITRSICRNVLYSSDRYSSKHSERLHEMFRATSFNFFSVKIPLKEASLEEKIHHKVEKVDKKGRENEALYRNLFGFFDLEVKNSSKTW
jgi:hypothetical protein